MAKKKICQNCIHYEQRNFDEGYCHGIVDLVVDRDNNANKCEAYEEKK